MIEGEDVSISFNRENLLGGDVTISVLRGKFDFCDYWVFIAIGHEYNKKLRSRG